MLLIHPTTKLLPFRLPFGRQGQGYDEYSSLKSFLKFLLSHSRPRKSEVLITMSWPWGHVRWCVLMSTISTWTRLIHDARAEQGTSVST